MIPIAAGPVPYEIDVAQIGPSAYVVAVGGDVGGGSASALKDALSSLASVAAARVVVDLGTITFVDAPLLGILAGVAHLLRGTGGELVLVTRDPRARRSFDKFGLGAVARIEPTLAGAVADGHAF
jgi:anti-anti-sigma factor